MYELQATAEERAWMQEQFAALTDEHVVIRPSAWAEEKRYLPPSVTSLPGRYSFKVSPYLREILDCMSVDSPVREVAVMKGVQIGATVGVLENALGYYIDHVRTAPCMLVTADAELAKLRVESYVLPMLKFSQLDHLIESSDETNKRKTGRTEKKLEWRGGGFLVPFGAQNANKLRSISIRMMLRDEIDGWPDVVGKDGDPIKLSADRTAAYEGARKILDISTPLIKGLSKIAKRFAQGDQRYYYVRCLKCEHPQQLRWRKTDTDGVVSGIVWSTDDDGDLIPDSVRYLCEQCQHPHTNDDKERLLSPTYGAEWRPTKKPISPDIRSYHISALYSPVGMQSWATCVAKWLDAWDVAANRPKSLSALQTFYNNVLGVPFELRGGERIVFEAVSSHRRAWYCYGQIPNIMCEQFCSSPVLILTGQVDVQGDNLAVSVFGWCRDRRPMLIDYWRFEGDTEHLESEPWKRLAALIESKEYTADDGRTYRLAVTLIDSGYRTDTVYRFCSDYEAGVFPVKGRAVPPKHAKDSEFSEFTTPMGTRAFGITIDFYKDRWSAALKREWNGEDLLDPGMFSAPRDATDKQLKELTVEIKSAKMHARTGEQIGWEWHRPSGAANELWDLLVYGNAAIDILAWDFCLHQLELEAVNWPLFWDRLVADLPPAKPLQMSG